MSACRYALFGTRTMTSPLWTVIAHDPGNVCIAFYRPLLAVNPNKKQLTDITYSYDLKSF